MMESIEPFVLTVVKAGTTEMPWWCAENWDSLHTVRLCICKYRHSLSLDSSVQELLLLVVDSLEVNNLQ